MAKRDDQDRSTVDPNRDDDSSVSGASAETPPTLPPYSGHGPQPLTLHGVPAADLLGADGGLEDLFDVPKLGAQSKSGPKLKSPGPPPLLPPLVSRKGGPRPPTTGPLPIIPPIGENDSQRGSQRGSQEDSRVSAPPRAEPTPGPQPITTSLPSASSLIERIRAAKRNADIGEGADDKGALASKPMPKPMPKLAPKLAPKPIAKQPAIAPPSEAPEPAVAPEPVVTPEPALTPEPAPSENLELQPEVAVAIAEPISEPVEAITDPSSGQAETADVDPVEVESAERHPATQTSTDPALRDISSEIGNDEPSQPLADTPTSMAGSARSPSGSALRAPPLSRPVIAALPRPAPGPSRGGPGVDEAEQTIAITKQAARLESPVLPISGSGPKLAPPPPQTSSGVGDDHPQIGVPYEPPAVIIRSESSDASVDLGSPHANEASPDEPRGLPRPGRLPPPSGRGPSGPPRPPAPLGPIAVEPIGQVEPIALAPAASTLQPEAHPGAPQIISPQDTASLIDGLTNEIIAEARAEAAATVHMRVPAVEVEDDDDLPISQAQRNRKIALYALAGVAVISLIIALLPAGREDAAVEDPAVEQLAQDDEVPEAEPEPQLAQADSADAAGSAGPAEAAEPDPAPVDAQAPEPDAVEPEPEPEPTPVAANNKSKPEPKPEPKSRPKQKPKPQPTLTPKPTPQPKPTPGGPTDTRDDQQLYAAAKAAYNSGSAAEAFKLADASYRKKSKSKTAELMTLAACKMKDKNKALTALNKVTVLRRNAMKKECKAIGLAL